jgi:serine/alanine adding enzyme
MREPDAATVRAVTDRDGAWRLIPDHVSHSTLAHAPEWFTVIRRAYGHDPLYFAAGHEAGCGGVLPAFVVRRPLFGTVVTSMPFLDGGGPCCSSPVLARRLFDRLMREACRLRARAVEMRCTERLPIATAPAQHKVRLILRLAPDIDRLWRLFDKSVRNQVRKAERSGLSIEVGGAGTLIDFYRVFASRMRDLGSPVHSIEFLRATIEEFAGRARIVLVRQGRMPIAGLVAVAFNQTLTVPWAACLSAYLPLCPNMLLYWETIRMASAEGFSRFDFGRSTVNSGTYRFKRQWGAQEEPLFWYTIPVLGHVSTRRSSPSLAEETLARAWRRLPVPITCQFGPRIRRYLTQ